MDPFANPEPRKRKRKELLEAGEAAAKEVFRAMPAVLREMGGEKRKGNGKGGGAGKARFGQGGGRGVVPVMQQVSARAATIHGGGISAESREKAVEALNRALVGNANVADPSTNKAAAGAGGESNSDDVDATFGAELEGMTMPQLAAAGRPKGARADEAVRAGMISFIYIYIEMKIL